MRLKLSLSCDGDMRLVTLRDTIDKQTDSRESGSPLVCSSEFQELTTTPPNRAPSGFGSISKRGKFGRRARRTVRQAGALFDTATKGTVVFLTGTLPGSTDEAVRALAAWSGWVVQTIKQWCRDTVDGAEYFGVWEYQKRGALHLHLCVKCPSQADAIKIMRAWKSRWILVLDGVNARAGVDVYRRNVSQTWRERKWIVRTDAQIVEKSVARYLSKYLSKGSCALRGTTEYPPSSWYFLSRNTRRSIRESERCMELKHLAPHTVLELFERIHSQLVAEGEAIVHTYQSPIDGLVRGIIYLTSPIQASLTYDSLARMLKCMAGMDKPPPLRPPKIADYLNWFDGRLIA